MIIVSNSAPDEMKATYVHMQRKHAGDWKYFDQE